MAASEYSNPAKAKDILIDMFLAYVCSDEFGNLTSEERKEITAYVDEMRNSMINEITGPK